MPAYVDLVTGPEGVVRPLDEESVSRLLPLRRVAPGRAPAGTVPVWISEAMVDLHGFDLGREFPLPLGGHAVRASVRGIWRDYERPGGAVVIPRDVFVRETGDMRATTAALWLEEGAGADAVSERIRSSLQRGGSYEIAVPRDPQVRASFLGG